MVDANMADQLAARNVVPVEIFTISTLPTQRKSDARPAIYAIRNKVTGNVYVGSSDHPVRRFRAHLSQLRRGIHHSLRLQWAWRNRGEEAFEFAILEWVEDWRGLIGKEEAAIQLIQPEYNTVMSAMNPMRGRKHTEESRRKMSERLKGVKRAPRTFSAEHREALRQAALARPKGAPRRAMSEEARRKLSEAAHARAASGVAPIGEKAVIVAGRTFPNCRVATESLGICRSTLMKAIRRGMAAFADDAIGPSVPWEIGALRGGKHPSAKRVIVGAQEFPSLADAARHFGKHQATMTHWINTGRARYADGSAPSTSNRRYRQS